ncbi:tigger transposable element-derived protein 6-like [Diadema antillarum]|uniref:tigger transposable element-derived protein 6-like n=1 Tax=Diadema antillarum TaxID=105358 RepID=UPI003A83BF98
MAKYTAESLQEALTRVKGGELSQRQAAKEYGIPRSTIYDKITGRRPEGINKPGPSPYFSMAEEARISKWAVKMSKLGYGRNTQHITKMAQNIVNEDGRETPFKDGRPGRTWFQRFMTRNPELAMRKPQGLGIERAILTPEKLDRWFEDLSSYLEEENVLSILESPKRIWNADESGFALGAVKQRVLAEKGARFVYNFESSTKTTLTTLIAASASGDYCPPYLIYPGLRASKNWKPLEGAPDEWFYGFSESGWMNSELFYLWLANHFHPYLKEIGVHFPVLLLADGHASHVDERVGNFCAENDIILYRIEAHASHVLQPLDIGVFAPLKKLYKRASQTWMDENPGHYITKMNFATIFADAWSGIDPQFARSGFRAAGIYPFSRRYRRDKVEASQLFRPTAANPGSASPATATPASSTTPASNSSSRSKPSSTTAAPASTSTFARSASSTSSASSTPTLGSAPSTRTAAPASTSTSRSSTSHASTSSSRSNSAPASTPTLRSLPSTSTAAPATTSTSRSTPSTSSSTSMPSTTSRKGRGRGRDFVAPSLDKYLVFPQVTRTERKKTSDDLPKAISGRVMRQYQQKKREAKEAEEERKRKRREEREAKKKCKKSGVNIREDSCADCQLSDDEEEQDWVSCSHCARWFHIDCTDLIGMNVEDVEAMEEFSCQFCNEM